MELINVGFGNLVSAQRIISIVSPDSAPMRRTVCEAKERGMVIDATQGRKTESVIIADSGHIILSYYTPERLLNSIQEN